MSQLCPQGGAIEPGFLQQQVHNSFPLTLVMAFFSRTENLSGFGPGGLSSNIHDSKGEKQKALRDETLQNAAAI